jgi:hypothetical protein
VALHQINNAITKLRECNGLMGIDDPVPGAPENAFRIIRKIMTNFPPPAGKPTRASTAAGRTPAKME